MSDRVKSTFRGRPLERSRLASSLGLFVLAATAALACDSNHDALAKKDAVAGAGAGGFTTSSSAATGSSSGAGGAGGGEPVEPDVETRLTFVNGIVDAPSVAFCLVPYPAGPSDELPWPSSSGLGFARAATLEPAAVAVASGADLEVRAVVGKAAALGGKSCSELSAAPGVAVRSLALVPASALAAKRDVVLVASGCVGGAGHDGPEAELACGVGYRADAPNAGLVAGYLSSLGDPTGLRLQFVHAVAAAAGTSTLGVAVGAPDAQPTGIEGGFTFGAIAPNPPYGGFTLAKLGELPEARLVFGNGGASADVPFAVAFANGGVDASGVKDGERLAFVVVGARPGLATASWWRAATAVALRREP